VLPALHATPWPLCRSSPEAVTPPLPLLPPCFTRCLQLIQAKLADMYTASRASRAFIYATARDADAGGSPGVGGEGWHGALTGGAGLGVQSCRPGRAEAVAAAGRRRGPHAVEKRWLRSARSRWRSPPTPLPPPVLHPAPCRPRQPQGLRRRYPALCRSGHPHGAGGNPDFGGQRVRPAGSRPPRLGLRLGRAGQAGVGRQAARRGQAWQPCRLCAAANVGTLSRAPSHNTHTHTPLPYYRRYINEYPTGRLLRDAKLYEIGAGTSGEPWAGHGRACRVRSGA
jgi:alkylation response protein AidB-like acyl-CoA dehydrogenase